VRVGEKELRGLDARGWRQARAHWAPLRGLPQARGHWLLGSLTEFQSGGSFVRFQERTFQQLQTDLFVQWMGMPHVATPMVVVRDAALGREIMVTQNIPKTVYQGLLPIMGMSLLTSNGDPWKKRRRMVNPGFSDGFLRSLEPTIDARVRVWVQGLLARARAGDAVVDPHTQLALVTLDVIGLVGPRLGWASTHTRACL
jgi:cytochrome P450